MRRMYKNDGRHSIFFFVGERRGEEGINWNSKGKCSKLKKRFLTVEISLFFRGNLPFQRKDKKKKEQNRIEERERGKFFSFLLVTPGISVRSILNEMKQR